MKLFCVYVTVLVCLVIGVPSAGFAMPKYATKTEALKLANALNGGTIGEKTISVAFVRNHGVKEFFLNVILSDGTSHVWYVDKIYQWVQTDELQLKNNRVLLFLNPHETKFVIFDKNKFHRLALQSHTYVKRFAMGDPLAGQNLNFSIKNFNLISVHEKGFGYNNQGEKYRYIIDLYNGDKELLTYKDAYYAMLNHNFKMGRSQGQDEGQVLLKHAYHVRSLTIGTKEAVKPNIEQFGIELRFDTPIQLKAKNFPIEIYEKRIFNKKTKEFEKQYILDIIIPNSEEKYYIPEIANLEYLHNIRVMPSPGYRKRMVLRARFNPEVLDILPSIEVNSDKSIYVSFFSMIDQSILNRRMLLEAEKRRQLEKTTERTITVQRHDWGNTKFGEYFLAAVHAQELAQSDANLESGLDNMMKAIDLFTQAALYAKNDANLQRALNLRNQLQEQIAMLTLQLVATMMHNVDAMDSSEYRQLIERLDTAEKYTSDAELLRQIATMRKRLVAIITKQEEELEAPAGQKAPTDETEQ